MSQTRIQKLAFLWNSGGKLRTVLIVPFVLQLFVAVGLVSYWSSMNGQQTISTLASQWMKEVDTRICNRLNAYLSLPRTINELNEFALELKELDPTDLRSFEKHFWQQSQIFEQVSYIQIGNEAGEFVGLAANDDGSLNYQVTDQTGNLNTYAVSNDGSRAKRKAVSLKFDPRKRPWYRVPKQAGKSAWTDIYAWVNPPTLAITLGQPYYDRQGEFHGILATDLTIAKISDFLKSLDIGGSGQAFIIEPNGFLVATSVDEQPFRVRDEIPVRLSATRSTDARTRAAAKFLNQQYEDLSTIVEDQQHTFEFQGQRQLLWISPVKDAQGLNWLTVLIFSESDFLGKIQDHNRLTLFLYLCSALIAVVIGIVTARWITRPIEQMNRAAREIALGNLHQQIPPSNIQELGELSNSFNEMAQQLQTSFEQMQSLNSALLKSEKQLADNNKNLEQQVQFQTKELVQAEKMAALGQLTAGIAHEINTPLGVIQASSDNIETALVTALGKLPSLLQMLPPQELTAFFLLVSASRNADKLSSSREERQLKKKFKVLLKEAEISPVNFLAETLSKMGMPVEIDAFLPILESENNVEVLNVAYQLSIVQNNSANIRSAIQRVSKIVFALKNYARHDLSKQMTKASITDSIETVLTLYHNQLKKGIEVVKNFRNIPEIWCYPEELSQVWTNLIHNSIQAMNYKGHLVILAYSNKTDIFVEVVDSGSGIPEEIREKIFMPFFTTKPAGEGSGLGLDIVVQIVKKHQGEISVDSHPGRTIFQVKLPILPEPPAENESESIETMVVSEQSRLMNSGNNSGDEVGGLHEEIQA